MNFSQNYSSQNDSSYVHAWSNSQVVPSIIQVIQRTGASFEAAEAALIASDWQTHRAVTLIDNARYNEKNSSTFIERERADTFVTSAGHNRVKSSNSFVEQHASKLSPYNNAEYSPLVAVAPKGCLQQRSNFHYKVSIPKLRLQRDRVFRPGNGPSVSIKVMLVGPGIREEASTGWLNAQPRVVSGGNISSKMRYSVDTKVNFLFNTNGGYIDPNQCCLRFWIIRQRTFRSPELISELCWPATLAVPAGSLSLASPKTVKGWSSYFYGLSISLPQVTLSPSFPQRSNNSQPITAAVSLNNVQSPTLPHPSKFDAEQAHYLNC